MKKIWLMLLLLLGTACATKKIEQPISAEACFANTQQNFSQVFHCYRQAQALNPLEYTLENKTKENGIEIRRYRLISQTWAPGETVTPAQWSHQITIMIPDQANKTQALLAINNGMRASGDMPARSPTDFPDEVLRAISTTSRAIIVAISDVPDQPLIYQGDSKPKVEDFSVAYSWSQFLKAPQEQPFMPLQIPAMAAAVKAMDLAMQELKPWQISKFTVTGISKRGWASWHTAIADPRVTAIVPFVFDALDFRDFMQHTYLTYGKAWPIALTPYYQQGIHTKRNQPSFEQLLRIVDPIKYLETPAISRLSIPKYIVNVSGDDFFPPDSARLYIDRLPGETALMVIPNSDHGGVKQHVQQTLISFLKRTQQTTTLPTLNSNLSKRFGSTTLSVSFSEQPSQLTQWTAINPKARDFRYACGIQYTPTPLDPTAANEINVLMPETKDGTWVASFVEARFADGFVATTPVYILPDGVYPNSPPPAIGRACQTIPDIAAQ
jgi:PhoPQ-activated pathogenicity-related protein